jgi:hypothetical protein
MPRQPAAAPGPKPASRRGLPALLRAALTSAAAAAAAAAAPAARLFAGEPPAEAFRRATGSLGLQTALPSASPEPDPISLNLSIPTPVIIALGVAVFLIVAWPWLKNLRLPQGDAPPEEGVGEVPSGAGVDPDQLGRIRLAADGLADQGRFSEAVHALLLETIELIKSTRRLSLPPSLTSREIAARLGLRQPAAGALGTLVGTVEPSWFGLREAGEADWLRCREAHDRLALAFRDRDAWAGQAGAGQAGAAPAGPPQDPAAAGRKP